MKRQTTAHFLWMLLVAAMVTGVSSTALAQEGPETARESGPIVRHKLLYRSTRLELAPMFGMTVADAYTRNGIAGLAVSYHLTNEFGLSLVGGYGVAQFSTNLRENVKEELEQNEADEQLQNLSYSFIQWLAGVEISYVPIFGKFSLFNSAIANYDIHLVGGLTLVQEAVETAVTGGEEDPSLEGPRPSPTIGLGMRLFLSEGISVNLEARDYIFSRAQVSSLGADPELTNNILVTLGVSFFLPQEVKISR